MSALGFISIAIIAIVVLGAAILYAVGLWGIKHVWKQSRSKKAIGLIIAAFLMTPFAWIGPMAAWFFIVNFPFTSGVIAHGFAPSGEEICVVQTFKDIEPYQVSLYAHRAGQPWVWNYLAHQDVRWRSCRLEFSGGDVRVFTGKELRHTFRLADLTRNPDNLKYQLPAELTPDQILARHNEYYRH